MDTTWVNEADERRFGPWEWGALALAVVSAAAVCFYWQAHYPPGAGWALALMGALAAGVVSPKARAEGVASPNALAEGKPNKPLLIACALLALTYLLFTNPHLRLLNMPVTLALFALTLFSANGRLRSGVYSPGALWEAASLMPRACVAHVGAPFSAFGRAKGARGALAGVLLAAPLVAVAVLLLGSADDVFAHMWTSLGERFAPLSPGGWLMRGVLAFVLALLEFSFLYSLTRSDAIKPKAPGRPGRQLTYALPLILLNALYAVFIAIQFVYLFGGAQAAFMKGGYAEYARKGFFELSAVCLMNLMFTCLACGRCGYTRLMRALTIITHACTGVMLASAAMRMGLYISVYGLSFLRALTIWGIFVMGAMTVASIVKAVKPATRAYPGALALVIAGWLAFNYINVDSLVAAYNIKAYERGRVAQLDEDYLRGLSPDALVALRALADDSEAARRASESISNAYADMDAFEWGVTRLLAETQ